MLGLCWHKWEQWSDVYMAKDEAGITYGFQSKICTKCKVVKVVEVGPAGDPNLKTCRKVVSND